uniref:Putative glycine-rich cell wall structural protein 1 n=1 Tax=Rhipicephalus microplus TaxID=6941 RepID=A0A6M2D468_RHIMP
MSRSGCALVIVALLCLRMSAAGYSRYSHGGHGVYVRKTSDRDYRHGHGHDHDYKTHVIKGPTFLVKTIHHIKKIHPGGGNQGHYSHGHGHGEGHEGYDKVIVIKRGHGHGQEHDHDNGHGGGLGGGHGAYGDWW